MTAVEGRGDADISRAAALFADPTRARVLSALADGRALPASVLASEAGVTPQAVSAQLARLREAGLIAVRRSGRHRYFRLASEHVATVLEALAVLAPARPVRSLREGTRAAALRRARTCYDHLAGRLGVAVTQALLARDALVPDTAEDVQDAAAVAGSGTGTDAGAGASAPGPASSSAAAAATTAAAGTPYPLSSPISGVGPYRLGEQATAVFGSLGIPVERLDPSATRRPLLRFCLDWSEQQPHLSGRLGADVLAAFGAAGWIVRRPGDRAVRVTALGADELRARLGVAPGDP